MVGLKICMSKVLSDMLLSTVHFAPTWCMGKNTTNTWFLGYSHFIWCRSSSMEWIS